ncbi:hypothetical protein P6166_10460 [Stenotrophomonas sp. HITSZ_GD]|uniref:hypothetical protein n=1 Tax=Stenotrophomonas sp. HITSZ_GD TaxID=3037248 RepID=UPI00240E0765|nr:hypothetical protein [Stenotrophomonas sp. HITSZ_GD]MDG2525774.1 hypothetical protein [Stenotrophomonas sp. HITSZ_GD]
MHELATDENERGCATATPREVPAGRTQWPARWLKAYLAYHLVLSGLMLLKQGLSTGDEAKILFAMSTACALWVLLRGYVVRVSPPAAPPANWPAAPRWRWRH